MEGLVERPEMGFHVTLASRSVAERHSEGLFGQPPLRDKEPTDSFSLRSSLRSTSMNSFLALPLTETPVSVTTIPISRKLSEMTKSKFRVAPIFRVANLEPVQSELTLYLPMNVKWAGSVSNGVLTPPMACDDHSAHPSLSVVRSSANSSKGSLNQPNRIWPNRSVDSEAVAAVQTGVGALLLSVEPGRETRHQEARENCDSDF
jgi:hypothetical protein